MRSKFVFLFLVLIIFSCDKKKSETSEESCSKESDKSFEMYKMSEMSTIMEQMYVDNQRLKQRILKGDTIGRFPDYFLRIRNATLTDPSEYDLFFKEHAEQFLEAQNLIYSDSTNAKVHFNAAVDACVKCHETKCGGPISRIKKLYIR
jgi:hypothetical protein